MALFYIDFGKLSNTISKYETILEQLDIFVDSLTATIAEIDEDVYEGMDATLVRDEWNTCATVDVPNAINQLTDIKNALVDSRKEFKECKQCCVEFADTFGISTSLIHLTGMFGVLKCDYDGLTSAGDYCYDIIEETSDIVSDTNVVKEMFSSLKGGSQDDLFELVEAIYVEANNIYNTIDTHKVELNTYGGKVKAADDNLNNRLKDILSVDPKYFNKLSCGMSDNLFDVGIMGNKISTRSPEYVFCINALENGSVDSNKLDEYNACLAEILASDEAEDFMTYMEEKCYKIEAYECTGLFADTLFMVGSHVNNSHDEDWIDRYKEVNKYLKEDLGITNDPLAAVEGVTIYEIENLRNEIWSDTFRDIKLIGEGTDINIHLNNYDASEDAFYRKLLGLDVSSGYLINNKQTIKIAYEDYKNGASIKDIFNKYAGAIPDDVLVNTLEAVSINTTLTIDDINSIYELNCEGWETYINDTGAHIPDERGIIFINDQDSINGKDYSMYYGKKNDNLEFLELIDESSFDKKNGYIYGEANMCEVIATGNAISNHIGETAFLPDIADDYLKMSPVLDGYGGTSPYSIPVLLNEKDIDTVFYYADDMSEEKYKYLYENCDGVIFTAWNGPNPYNAIHTMYISIEESESSSTGYFCTRHNDRNGFTEGEDLQILIEDYSKMSGGAICIIGVMKE